MFKRLPIVLSLIVLLFPIASKAVELTDYSTKLQENLKQQQALEQKIGDTRNKQKTLANQISFIDNQVKLTELKVEETKTNIERLGGDIQVLTEKLSRLGDSLEHLTTASQTRLRSIHEQSFVDPVAFFLNSKGFNDLLLRFKYLEIVRAQDLKILEQMRSTQTNYNDQKNLLQDKKTEQESLKSTLERQEIQLASQKKEKQNLLQITKNDEANYQSLLAQLKAEYEIIRKALSNRGTKIGPVKRGDVIGTIGEGLIGCSTGPHLHFEVDINNSAVDPAPYIASGQFIAPTVNYPGNIHQGFGDNKNILFYGPLGHTGIDMGDAGDLVYAAADGEASFVVDQAPCVRNGIPGRAIIIDHGNNTKTLYLHVR